MNESNDFKKFTLATEQAKKLNILLPKGYKFITQEEFKKKSLFKTKKKTIMGLPTIPQILNSTISINRAFSHNNIPAFSNIGPPAFTPPSVRTTKNTKSMQIPSYQSIPQPSTRVNQKIPLNFQYYQQKRSQNNQPNNSFSVFNKLKNYPLITELQKISSQPEQRLLSFKQIQKKVYLDRDNYEITQLITDISKLCLKIYESYPYSSNEYQNTVSIQKYLKSLTRVEKPDIIQYQSKPSLSSNLPPLGLKRRPTINRPYDSNSTNNNSIITIKQKRQLGQRIKKLPSQCLQQICYILFQNLQNKEYSFDLDTLHIKKIRQLQEYVNTCMEGTGQYTNIKENEDDNNSKINQDDDGEESSFIIQVDADNERNGNEDAAII